MIRSVFVKSFFGILSITDGLMICKACFCCVLLWCLSLGGWMFSLWLIGMLLGVKGIRFDGKSKSINLKSIGNCLDTDYRKV